MNPTKPSMEAINIAFHKFSDSLSPDLMMRMNGRLERGLQIAQSGGVVPYNSNSQMQFKVKSSNPTNPPYLVDLSARTCNCPDHLKGHYCKHRVAAQIYKLSCVESKPEKPQVQEPAHLEPAAEGHAMIWACVNLSGKNIGVEILGIENNMIWVQALPVIKDGKLEPSFPFQGGSCTQLVKDVDLQHIRIFRDA